MPDYVPCPQCGSTQVQKVGFTWWGGIVGPAMLTHVQCQACRNTFNGKTGKSNTTGIVIYSVVGFVLAAILLILVFSMK